MHHWPQRAPSVRDDGVAGRIRRESGLHRKATVQGPVASITLEGPTLSLSEDDT